MTTQDDSSIRWKALLLELQLNPDFPDLIRAAITSSRYRAPLPGKVGDRNPDAVLLENYRASVASEAALNALSFFDPKIKDKLND